jgi:hypothetical protein
VVDNSISVNTDASSSASLDHVTELFTAAMTTSKLVRDWLVVEPPRIKLTVLRPLVAEDRLHHWENSDSHPASLRQIRALLLNVSMRPSKHLNNTSLLSIFVN